MATINYAAREISVKIVYYGPGLSGKTTNLQIIHRKIPQTAKSDMVSLATETDRTLFFDFLPLDLGKIRGFSTKFQLYTVPGQVYYNATRKLVLRGVDGIVFVADSAADKMAENHESFGNMEENIAEYGYKRETIPTIIQYNKRDLPNALPVDELNRQFNKYNLLATEAIANKGHGVFESLKQIGKLVIDQLNQKYASPPKKRSSIRRPAAQRPIPMPMQKPPAPKSPLIPPKSQPSPFLSQKPAPIPAPAPAPAPNIPIHNRPTASIPTVTPQQPNPEQYGNINLEPMIPAGRPAQNPAKPPQPVQNNKSELDMEMERYYEKSAPQQNQFAPPQPIQKPAYQQPQFNAPQQQHQVNADEPIFDPSHRPNTPINPQQHQQNVDEPIFDPSHRPNVPANPQQHQAQANKPLFDPSRQPNMQFNQQQPPVSPPPSYMGQQQSHVQQNPASFDAQPSQFQQTQQPKQTQGDVPEQNQFDMGAENFNNSNEPTYFTSIDTNKSKKKGKRPINPRHQAKKNFLGNLFNRDETL